LQSTLIIVKSCPAQDDNPRGVSVFGLRLKIQDERLMEQGSILIEPRT